MTQTFSVTIHGLTGDEARDLTRFVNDRPATEINPKPAPAVNSYTRAMQQALFAGWNEIERVLPATDRHEFTSRVLGIPVEQVTWVCAVPNAMTWNQAVRLLAAIDGARVILGAD